MGGGFPALQYLGYGDGVIYIFDWNKEAMEAILNFVYGQLAASYPAIATDSAL